MGVFDGIKKQAAKAADAVTRQAAATADNVKKQAEKVKEQGSSLIEKTKSSLNKKEPTPLLREEDAIRVLYYLMAADGEISPEEKEKLYEIGRDMDPAFEEHKETLIHECEDYLDTAVNEEDRYDILHEHAVEAIRASQAVSEGTVQPRVFIWNLLTVAFAEGEYSANEIRLIRALARLLNVDPVTLKELETSLHTLMAIVEEEQWLKSSGRSYGEVEVHINELADRKNVVMQGVMALMLD